MARFKSLKSFGITSQVTLGTNEDDGLVSRVGSFNFGVPLFQGNAGNPPLLVSFRSYTRVIRNS